MILRPAEGVKAGYGQLGSDCEGGIDMAKLIYGLAGLLILIGLIWMGQGSGYFPYPPESFMIDQTPWIYWGALAAAAGLVIIVVTKGVRRGT
jgi:hypothetical protein